MLHRCFHFFASTTHGFCFKISVPSTFSNHLQVGYISHHLASRAKTPRGFLKIDPGRCMDCWACPACTFENLPTAECCEICEKGRRGQRKTMGNAQEVEKSLKHIEIPFFRRYSCLPGYLGLTPKVWQFHSNNYQKPEDLGVPIFRHFQTKPYVFIDFCHFYIGSCFAKLVHCLFFFESHNSNIL